MESLGRKLVEQVKVGLCKFIEVNLLRGVTMFKIKEADVDAVFETAAKYEGIPCIKLQDRIETDTTYDKQDFMVFEGVSMPIHRRIPAHGLPVGDHPVLHLENYGRAGSDDAGMFVAARHALLPQDNVLTCLPRSIKYHTWHLRCAISDGTDRGIFSDAMARVKGTKISLVYAPDSLFVDGRGPSIAKWMRPSLQAACAGAFSCRLKFAILVDGYEWRGCANPFDTELKEAENWKPRK